MEQKKATVDLLEETIKAFDENMHILENIYYHIIS